MGTPTQGSFTMTVFTNPADLTAAVLDVVNPGPLMAPTMGERLASLVAPGRVIGFRTESGSLYEASIYTTTMEVRGHTGHRVLLHKIVDDRPVLMAEGLAKASHDKDRDVWGLIVDEPSGRYLRTSAITEAWLAYDATVATV